MALRAGYKNCETAYVRFLSPICVIETERERAREHSQFIVREERMKPKS